VPGGQGVIRGTIPELNSQILRTRQDWLRRGFSLEGYDWLVTRADVQAGAPTIRGTRIETSVVARLVTEDKGPLSVIDLEQIIGSCPQLRPEAIWDALDFEGIPLAA
jgi:uncharacterized protein (DUF433 family)